MFNKKKDYIKKKYKDVPQLNIGDVNRILQSSKSDEDRFRMFTQMLTIKTQNQQQQHINNTQEILQQNVMRLVELYGDTDINYEALEQMYIKIDQNEDVEQQIIRQEVLDIPYLKGDDLKIEVISKISKYEHYLTVLQTKMAKNIFSNYGIYLEAMETIDEINDTSIFSLEKVKHLRSQIQTGKQVICVQSQVILQKKAAIENIQNILKIVEKIKSLYQIPYQIYVDSLNTGSIDVTEYLPLINNIEIMDLQMIPTNYIQERIDYSKQITVKGIIDQFIQFNESKYVEYIKSYKYFESIQLLPKFGDQIANYIMQAYDIIIQKVLQSASESLSIDFYFDNLTDSLLQIPKDQLIDFYREFCCQSINFMMNLHLCQRFHQKSELEQTMLQLRKHCVELICLKFEEIIQITIQWTKMRKEDIICFFGMLSIFIAKCENFTGYRQTKLEEYLKNKFHQYLISKGNDKLIKDFVLNEDCKKCLKISLNQTQVVLQMAEKCKYMIFDFTDPFPENLNVYKSLEFNKIIELFQGHGMSYKKSNNPTSIIYQGKERNLLLTYTANQIYYLMQQYLIFIIFCKEEQSRLIDEFSFLIEYYIYNILISMSSEHYKKILLEDTIQLNIDLKQDPENYIHQFESTSEQIIFKEQHPDLIKFIRNFKIPEELQIIKNDHYELADRIVFVESIIFLITELNEIKAILPQFSDIHDLLVKIVGSIQTIVYKSSISVELASQLMNAKYEIKANEKDDPIRQQVIEKIILFYDIKITGLSQQQQLEFQKCIGEGVSYQLIETFSRIKKVNNLGREAMLNDFQKISKALQYDNQNYELFIKIFNQIQPDLIIEYIHNNLVKISFIHQKVFPFKILNNLFFSQIMQSLKKQQKREYLQAIFQKYSQ